MKKIIKGVILYLISTCLNSCSEDFKIIPSKLITIEGITLGMPHTDFIKQYDSLHLNTGIFLTKWAYSKEEDLISEYPYDHVKAAYTNIFNTHGISTTNPYSPCNADALGLKLNDLKGKFELHQHNDVHVGLEITLEHIMHVQNLLNQILEKYREVFKVLPPNMKIYTITQKLKETEMPSVRDLAKEVLTEVLSPGKPEKLTKKEQIEIDAKAISARRALDLIKKNSAKGNQNP